MKTNPTHRDKRSRLDLELFVLALVQRDVYTPYRLRETVGLSPGATIPVLKRLQDAGYVRPGKPGARGRTEFKITAKGKHYLASGWQPLLDAPALGDLEAVLRIASLALLSGADKKTVYARLTRAAAVRSAESKRKKCDASAMEASLSSRRDVDLYLWMQAALKAARLNAEVRVLRRLAIAILRRPN